MIKRIYGHGPFLLQALCFLWPTFWLVRCLEAPLSKALAFAGEGGKNGKIAWKPVKEHLGDKTGMKSNSESYNFFFQKALPRFKEDVRNYEKKKTSAQNQTVCSF